VIVKVVDASVAAALIFVEDNAEAAAALLADALLIAPKLLAYEIANIAVTRRKREPESAASIAIGLSYFRKLNISLVDVDHSEVVDLAMRYALTAYDASYLWLSQTENAGLLTFDKRLSRATLSN
jgi:predicted nucleic acid-binding protein